MAEDDARLAPLEELVGSAQATVPDVLESRAEKTPDGVFLETEEGRWTYRQGLEEAQRLAAFLIEIGAGGPGSRVASFLPNSPRSLWTWFGSHVSGAIYVPLHRGHRGELLAELIRRVDAEILVTDAEGLGDLPELRSSGIDKVLLTDDAVVEHPCLKGVKTWGWESVTRMQPVRSQAGSPLDVATLLFTSGTTGRSKAVRLPANQFTRGGARIVASLDVGPHDTLHAWLPLYHIGGQLDMVMPMVIGGGTLALQKTFSRTRFWDEVHRFNATIFIAFTSTLELLFAAPEQANDAENPLRAGIVGWVPAQLGPSFERRFGVELFDVYGQTEAEPLALPEPGRRPPVGSCGPPNPDYEVRIMDDSGRILPPHHVGEIVARPRQPGVMMRGYEGDADATGEAFEDLWLHTGDLGYLDDEGFLYFQERRRHAIRRRGESISAWELERVLLGHPGVAECAVVGVPSSLGGDDEVKAVIVAASDRFDPNELVAWCEGRVARFMIPRYIEVTESLPRTDTGRVQKERLKTVTAATWDAEARQRLSTPPSQLPMTRGGQRSPHDQPQSSRSVERR